VAGALLLSSCQFHFPQFWPQLRWGPDGTGFNPFEGTIGLNNVAGLQLRWSEPSAGNASESSPVEYNGVVYVTSSDGRLEAFDATTGNGDWSYQMSPFTLGNPVPSPAVDNGEVYAGSSGALYAFDAGSGTRLWSTPTSTSGSQVSSPVVANGIVYASSSNGNLSAFNETDGTSLWSVSAGAQLSTPAVANGVVYIDSTGATLEAFDASTGRQLWSAPAATMTAGGSVAVANGVVYLAADKLYAFDATSGRLLWSVVTGGGSESASPAVANGVVYASSNGGMLEAFGATTGAPWWSASTGGARGATSPVVANGVVYVGGGDGKLHAFNATSGTRLWSSTAGSGGEPVVAAGVVYAGSIRLLAYSFPAPGAGLTVSPTFSPDFGTLPDGTSSPPTTFTVTNFGSSATSAISDALGGAEPSQFHVGPDTCNGAVLAGGASCNVEVEFAPTTPGAATATMTVSAATGGSVDATLSGTGNPLTIHPEVRDFGSVLDGTSSRRAVFTVTNGSSTTLTPTIGSLAGSPFTARADTCSGATLVAGATCSVAVVFTPTGVGRASALLSVSGTPAVLAGAVLSGTQLPLAISPPREDYGTVPIGSSSPATFNVTNMSSTSPLPLTASVNQPGSGFGITSDNCSGQTLAPSAGCTVIVTFSPYFIGADRGQLIVGAHPYGPLEQATLIGSGG
jgi:outer membrane protein assembly factor BamB